MDKYHILEQQKRPVGLKKHVGIEIEFVSAWDRDDIEDLLIKHNLHANCTIKDDTSIDEYLDGALERPEFYHTCNTGSYYFGLCNGCAKEGAWEKKHEVLAHEMTILTTEDELLKILNKVNIVLKKCNAQVNKSCGLHVHLDMRNRDFKKSVKLLLGKQKEFRKMVKKHRLDNTHCLPLKKHELKLNPITLNRYKDINMQAYTKFGTVEIRIHEGTVDTSEIYNWCRYLIATVDNKKASVTYVKRRIMECA